MFGNTQNTGGGLFGGQKTGGGLFGQTNQQTTGGGGIFGGGNPTQGQPQSTGGGLFGSNPQPTGGGGLFGGGQSTSGGGLFGQSQNQTAMQPKTGGLFGGNTGGGSSMMGGSSNTGGGGLFGSKPATTSGGGLFGGGNKPSGGLFGGGAATQSTGMSGGGGGGLFGSKPATTGGGGLFGGGAAATQQKSSFFGGGQSSGGGGLFGGGQPQTQSTFGSSNQANLQNGSQPSQQQPSSSGFGSFGASGSTAKPSGGLFGSSSTSTTQNKPAGGLFGSSSTTATSGGGGGGLFGGGSKPAGSSLFGGGSTSTPAQPAFQKSTGGGLFGGGGNTPSFGNTGTTTAQPSSSGGGLFGSTASKPAGGGLFGSSTQSKPAFGSSSGFGGGSTFGASSGTTSAFGAAAKPTGGLFSSGTTSSGFGQSTGGFGQSTTTSGFGQTSAPAGQTTAQPAPQQADANYIQAYSSLNDDPYGTKDLQNAFKLTSIDPAKQTILNKIVDQVLKYSGQDSESKRQNVYESNDLISNTTTMSSAPISLKLHRRGLDDEFTGSFKRQDHPLTFKKSTDKFNTESEARSRQLEYDRVKQDEEYLRYTNKFLKNRKKEVQEYKRTTPKETSEEIKNTIQRSKEEPAELTGPNILRVKVSVFVDDSEEVLILSIDKSRKIRELIELAVSKLRNKYTGIESSLIQIVHRSRILNQENTLEDSGVQSGMRFDMLVQEKPSYTTTTAKPETATIPRKRMSEDTTSSHLAPIDKLPKAKRHDYTITPSILEMARMNEYELMNIKELTIENQWGRITWPGRTDVTGIDFDELVIIAQFAATVYPDEIERQGRKHDLGQGLNKPAVIELFQIKPPVGSSIQDKERFIERLKNKASCLDDTTFLNYDERNGVLKFRVEHFTKYDFSSAQISEEPTEEQEEQEESEESQANQEHIKDIREAHEDPRFSFGHTQKSRSKGVPLSVAENYRIEDEVKEDYSDEEMETDRHQSYNLKRAQNFLQDIQEESSSKMSAADEVQEQEDEEMEPRSKKHMKLQFGDVYEKEFEEGEPYEEPEYEAEEEEEISQGDEQPIYFVTPDSIRAHIKRQKQEIQKSLAQLNEQRLNERKNIPVTNNFKLSEGIGYRNQMLFLKKSNAVNAVIGKMRLSFTTQLDKSVEDKFSSKFTVEDKNKIIDKYLTTHYVNILENHLRASEIDNSSNQEEGVMRQFGQMNIRKRQTDLNMNISARNLPLPIVVPPETPQEFSEMWYETLKQSRGTLSPSIVETNEGAQILLSEIKKIIKKDCQVFALMNACFGNSFVDLAKFMNRPSTLTMNFMQKYKDRKDEHELRHRNHLIENWIKYATEDEIKDILKAPENKDLDIYLKASLYLYCGNKKAAVDLLTAHGKHNYASLVSQSASSGVWNIKFVQPSHKQSSGNINNSGPSSLRDQNMEDDAEMPHRSFRQNLDENLQKQLTPSAKNLLEFINGGYGVDDKVSWKCSLGRAMWYCEPNFRDAFDKLCQYIDMYEEEKEKDFVYNDPLMFEILSLYHNPRSVNETFFREQGIDGDNSAVRRTLWSVMTCLKQLNKYFADIDEQKGYAETKASRETFQRILEEYYVKITYDYAYELEEKCLWKWAIFVVLHLENNAHKTKYIKEKLLKYVGTEENTTFLTEDCKIPMHYIHEAKAVYYSSKGLHGKAFYQWIQGEFYQNAHDELLRNMTISSESVNEKFNDLLTILTKLEENKEMIKNWDSQGKVLYEFITLRRDLNIYFEEFFDQYGDFKLTRNERKKQKASTEIEKFRNRLDKLIKLFKRFEVTDINSTPTVTKTELKRILLDWDNKINIISCKLSSDKAQLQFPNQYLMDSDDLTLNDKKNVHDKFVTVTLAEFISAN